MKPAFLALSFVAVVLVFAVVVQMGLVTPKPGGMAARKPIPSSLSAELPGWRAEDLPVGPTEMDNIAISRRLNYDWLIYRRYSSAKGSFSLYMAYWAPQRMAPSQVGSHTPDRCWALSGWTCEASSFSWKCNAGDRELFPAQYRQFRDPSGQVEQVIYWHIVGGKPYGDDFRIDGSRGILTYWKSNLLYCMGGDTEQYFVRLDSDRRFEEIWDDPGFHSLMESLAGLCLARNPSTSNP